MNGDPYRTPQPADRRVINRSGQTAYQRAEEQPQPVNDEQPKTVPRSSSVNRPVKPEKNSRKGLWLTLSFILLALIIATVGWFIVSNPKKSETGIDTSRYQAVFLVNGQIYFGKLKDANEKSFKLTDIYYPQAQSTSTDGKETTDTKSSGIQLIKLGDEVHGPENEMYVSKDQILYYENLKADSKVAQLIQQNEKSK